MSRRDYAACADLFGAAGEAFTAASCQAMAGNADAAFAYLARAIDGNFRSLKRFDDDSGAGRCAATRAGPPNAPASRPRSPTRPNATTPSWCSFIKRTRRTAKATSA